MKKTIRMTNINDIYELVRQAERVNGDVIISRGKYAVDGKSLLGIMSLNLSEDVVVEYPGDATEFNSYIERFAV